MFKFIRGKGGFCNKGVTNNIALIITFIGLLVLISGTSYAILKGTTTSSTEQIIMSGNVSLKLNEKYVQINKKIRVMSDEEGLSQNETYDFSITNIGSVGANYKLKLINEVPSDYNGNLLSLDYIKVGLEINDRIFGPVSLGELEGIIDEGIINKDETINYKLVLWLDKAKEKELEGMADYQVFLKLKVDAEQFLKTNLDTSGANEPVLSKNMIAVYYDDVCDDNRGCWKKADSTNTQKAYKWYDYNEKMWANSITVTETNRETYKTAPEGTKIPMEDILTMQVWVPRYKYKVWNYNLSGTVTSEPQEIDITFENETEKTGEITCTDNVQGTSDGTPTGTEPLYSEICKVNNTNCTDELCNNKTYTHPAFTFGDKELTGIWVGKFELSSDINCSAGSYSALETGCNLASIRPNVKPNVTSWSGAMVSVFENNMMAMNDSNNKYGFSIADDTHMIKNMEWGAVAYLSHSKYGINKEVAINSANTYTTGCGPQSEVSTSSGTTCNAYNTTLGQTASTTGNIYGIYDMSGGSYEYVMGNILSPDGTIMMSGYAANTSYPNRHSGYDGILYYNRTTSAGYGTYDGTYSYPDNKYIDKYSFNTSSSTRSISKLGDGIREVLNTSSRGWYEDNSYIAFSNYSWCFRGGSHSNNTNAGIFYSDSNSGSALPSRTSRLVITQ